MTKRTKIAVNAAFVGDKSRGIISFAKMLIEGLAGRPEYQVEVHGSADNLSAGNIHCRQTSRTLCSENGFSGNLLRLAWMQTALPFHLRQFRPDVFLSPSFEGMLHPPVPQVIVLHDVIPILYPNEAPQWALYFKYVLPRILSASSLIFANSAHTKHDIMQHFRVSENKIVVAYPGVDPLYYQSCVLQSTNHEERRQKYFVFVGTFTARKNLESVVRAFATIAEEVEEELVVVAYWDPERGGKLKSLAEQLGVLPRIKFVSGLSGPELANLYRNATAAILLSEYEGFGYPAAEAMACGTPVIVSDSTSLAEVTADAALKVSCHDITGAANAMLRLASDETVRRELSSAGKQRATLFTCERFAQALHAGIEDALR